MNRKPFIVFEGLDGAGKTTQIKLLNEWLVSKNIPCTSIREPGSTNLGEEIRRLLKTYEMNSNAELLLFNAARSMLLEQIKQELETKWVLCDRFTYSTWAYQHYARNVPASKLKACEEIIDLDIKPDMVVFFEHSLRTTVQDRLEALSREKILAGYHELSDEKWVHVPKDNIKHTSQFIISKIKSRFGI